MAALKQHDSIAVIGAGTMGAGIAQVAASAGHSVVLFDVVSGAAQRGKESVQKGLEKLVTRGRKTQAEVDDLLQRIETTQTLATVKNCRLVIEAIVEDLDIKRRTIADIEALCGDDTIIASNTSSISISALAARACQPQNIVGMHFFNPAAILKLVEVVSGLQTNNGAAQTVFDTALAWGKSPVHARSTPGFIVNRVARPFYAEALRSLTEQVASAATIDTLMRSCGGFKMGPLELTDLIGQDINSAVSESVYDAFFQDKRLTPSVLQAEMVAAGLLGRKSGAGFYDYSAEKPAAEVLSDVDVTEGQITIIGELGPIDGLLELLESTKGGCRNSSGGFPRIEAGTAVLQLTDGRTATQRAADQGTPNLILFDFALDYESSTHIALSVAAQASVNARNDAVALFQSLGKQVCLLKDVPGMQVMRTLSRLVNEAFDAVNQGVCSAEAVDIAMQAGVAYPIGPFEFGKLIGEQNVTTVLQNIQASYGEERYRVSPLLKMRSLMR